MRQWVSIRGPGGLRFGQSIGPEDFRPPKLPSWRRYELRLNLQAAAEARGEPLSADAANYTIDKALAFGMLDGTGNHLNFNLRGSREEIIAGIMARATAWGFPMTEKQATRMAEKAIGKHWWGRRWWVAPAAGLLILAWYGCL